LTEWDQQLNILGHGAWPIIVSVQIAMGLLIGFVEGWSLGDAVHFTFVTALILLATISYRGGLAHQKAA
jgi:hypothetical protein